MSEYRHAYSDYINHILDNSPTKVAYSFAKKGRFEGRKTEQGPMEDHSNQLNGQKWGRNERVGGDLRGKKDDKAEEETKKKKKDDYEIFKVRKDLDRILKEM